MASGRYNTMAEGLAKIAQDLTMLMATPDADLEFLTEMQTDVLRKMREPFEGTPAGAAFGPSGGADAGQGAMPPEIAAMMGGAMPPSPIPMGGGGGGMGPGAMPGAGAPSMDETRRLMS